MEYKETVGLGTDFLMTNKDDTTHIIENKPDFGLKTKVIMKNHETGEVVFVGKNKTMLSGSEFMAMKLFYLPHNSFVTPTYNTALGLDNTVYTSTPENTYCTQLFCMGTSGCNRESALRYEVINKSWIAADDLVPFQYVPYTADLDSTNRAIYYGRKDYTDKKMIAYYFKKFDSDPTYKVQLEDGTAIDSNIYSDTSELVAQVMVTNSLTITKDDGRDYFINTTGINDGRFNCIELCLAWYKVINGFSYYQDIRPCTRINFPNKYFADLGASWDIVYQIYF
jgi:hypothetical protein